MSPARLEGPDRAWAQVEADLWMALRRAPTDAEVTAELRKIYGTWPPLKRESAT